MRTGLKLRMLGPEKTGPAMIFPRTVAAHRLQNWLLVTALFAIVGTALLVIDLARSLRSVVIGDTHKALTNASSELVQAANRGRIQISFSESEILDQVLKENSYEVLRSYLDVEGGYLLNSEVIGHSFPSYTERGSVLRQPPFEHSLVLAALEESLRSGKSATRMGQDGADLVLVAVQAIPDNPLAVWTLRRIFNFSSSSELYKRLLLVFVMFVAVIAICTVLKLSFNLQQGFRGIQAGLEKLQSDLGFRLPEGNQELEPIVRAVNRMAESRQKLEAALRTEDRLRVMGRVAAGIAHEIRNPLNSIRLTVRVLARSLKNDQKAGESIELVTAEIDRLDSLLNSLLMFRSEEPAKIKHQPLQPILDRTLALVSPHASDQGVNLCIESSADYFASVDRDYLQQALMNLLLNAVDASGPNGKVSVYVVPNGSWLEILVEDNGPGLNNEQQDRLFEAFYTTKPGGTGLGLAVTRTLLEKMGATIDYAGGTTGARFRVVLPKEVAA